MSKWILSISISQKIIKLRLNSELGHKWIDLLNVSEAENYNLLNDVLKQYAMEPVLSSFSFWENQAIQSENPNLRCSIQTEFHN